MLILQVSVLVYSSCLIFLSLAIFTIVLLFAFSVRSFDIFSLQEKSFFGYNLLNSFKPGKPVLLPFLLYFIIQLSAKQKHLHSPSKRESMALQKYFKCAE